MKHSENCTRVFKNYDLTCPRCIELSNGSEPRKGWQAEYYKNKATEGARLSQQITAHFASEEHKAEIICTAFDW